MKVALERFEAIAREAGKYSHAPARSDGLLHPFDLRNLHPCLPSKVRELFDDGHYSEATFEAMKFLDLEVQRLSGVSDFGKSLMLKAFGGATPALKINGLASVSDESEQEGYRFLFAGTMAAIRNPKGHKVGIRDDPDKCLDQLGLVTLLLRRLEEAGLV
jgi:uncharacterized protein (TIGR02391 family)